MFLFQLIICSLIAAQCLITILSFGYYGAFGIAVTVSSRLLFLLLKVSLLLMLARWSLNLKLQTQVLTQGRVLLLAYDEFESETIRIKLDSAQ